MNFKKRKIFIIFATMYLVSELISNGLNGNWSIWYLISENWGSLFGFLLGMFLFIYFDKDIK